MFIDESIEIGARWPDVLRRAIAHSRVLVAFLSVAYFESRWCRRELALMLEREKLAGVASDENRHGLIIPVWIMDGERFPTIVTDLQLCDLRRFVLVCHSPKSETYEQFILQLTNLVKAICGSINQAPNWSSDWKRLTGASHYRHLRAKSTIQRSVPRLRFKLSHST